MTRIATFNVNGVNGPLPVLLKWLAEPPDIVCLQELQKSDEQVSCRGNPGGRVTERFGTVRNLTKGVAILPRGTAPVERRRGLPGDPDDAPVRHVHPEKGSIGQPALWKINRIGSEWIIS